MTERMSHHMSFMAFCMKSFDSCLADFWLLPDDPEDLPDEVVVLEDEPPWPEAEDAIDMADVTMALATAVAVEPERPPVREALAAEDMVSLKLEGFAGVGGVDVGDDDCRTAIR
jgi:hypothetical protein